MSTGARYPLALGQEAARYVMSTWGMRQPECREVGSVRRQSMYIGDLELIAPMPADGARDDLFESMDRTMESDGLFGAGTVALCRPGKGFKRHFRSCTVHVSMEHSATKTEVNLPVQVYRYDHDGSNRGWIELMRTGPAAFGQWFLGVWKHKHHISVDNQASIDGHLCLSDGSRVNIPTEESAFAWAGLKYIHPTEREAHMRRMDEMRSGARR